MADAMVATWQAIAAALAPIVGSQGVAALYHRSLHLTVPAHPWLAELREGQPTAVDLAALRSVIARQDGTQAEQGCNALLQTFQKLLGSLIGVPLTERLLRPVWAASKNGPPSQDRT